ncbi:hypothetical protein [Primorskyibacter sp. 2E233]|uniref:hypothetical protein n=1 Tax=Primorskyibacter sp. 2E233 TaxID=3413431 RepID=UPI003BF1BB5F
MTEKYSALDIYRRHLDIVTTALWGRDWETLARNLAVPSRIRTQDTEIVMTTEQDLFEHMFAVRKSLGTLGATNYQRIPIAAEYTNADKTEIEGTHTVYVLGGGSYIMEPFVSSQTLIRQNGVWKGYDLKSGVKNSALTVIDPQTILKFSARKQQPSATKQGSDHA